MSKENRIEKITSYIIKKHGKDVLTWEEAAQELLIKSTNQVFQMRKKGKIASSSAKDIAICIVNHY